MKNVFKLGFLIFALALSLTSCNWFSNSPKTEPIDSNKIDTPKINMDSPTMDSNKINADTTKIKQ